jgi:hypothetical protein
MLPPGGRGLMAERPLMLLEACGYIARNDGRERSHDTKAALGRIKGDRQHRLWGL